MSKKKIENNKDINVRADVLMANAYPEYSRSALAKLFDLGLITQEKKPIKPGDKIKPGQLIVSDISLLQKKADDIDLPIIYEDNNVIVIDKPVGVISHARGRYWDEASVASFVRSKVADMEGERAGIVHRLDRAIPIGVAARSANDGEERECEPDPLHEVSPLRSGRP